MARRGPQSTEVAPDGQRLNRVHMNKPPVGGDRERTYIARENRSDRFPPWLSSLFRASRKVSARCRAASYGRQPVDRRPEVQHVPLEPAPRMEALEYVLAKIDGEGPPPIPGRAMHRAGPAALAGRDRPCPRRPPDARAPVPCVTCSRKYAKSIPGRPAGMRRGSGLTSAGSGPTLEMAVVTTAFAGKSRLWPTAVSSSGPVTAGRGGAVVAAPASVGPSHGKWSSSKSRSLFQTA